MNLSPPLGPLKPVMDITKQKPSVPSEFFPNFFFLCIVIFVEFVALS
jgi:hypothetical protein